MCYDREPSSIIVSDSRRDAGLDDTDSFQIIFDTYRDLQNGFVFGTNPAAIEYDGQVTNEGQGGGGLGGGNRQQSGSGGGFNLNWDAAWEVRTKIDERGWSAEFAIPFSTLRYPAGVDQVWGVNFQRNIRRRNERAYWSPIPRQYSLYRLSLAGSVTGIQAPAIRSFKATPYVLGNLVDSGERPVETKAFGDVGGDFKYTLTPSLTLDATINTDFAQVEVDDQQVNLDRFTLFFPEKRPFFLENAGFFSVGNPGEVDLFFSRRIGIGDENQPIAILGGGRVSGKAGAVQHRPAQHADRRRRPSSAEQQLLRRARQPRPAEPLVDRRALRQSPGHRRSRWRRQRSQPDLRGRRQMGHRAGHRALELRRAHRDARGRRTTSTRSTCGRAPTCRATTSSSAIRRSATTSIRRSASSAAAAIASRTRAS